MGIRNYLIEGISGTGKTTVAEELERRGYDVVHGDRVLASMGDPATGKLFTDFPPKHVADSPEWKHKHWIWDESKVRSLTADKGNAITFFCGGSRNLERFVDLFDAVFILEIDAQTLKWRLEGRPEDEFGGRPEEQELIVKLHATKEEIPKHGITINATMRVEQVVDEILARCELTDWKAT
jgi:broad-specificity NMP kinase